MASAIAAVGLMAAGLYLAGRALSNAAGGLCAALLLLGCGLASVLNGRISLGALVAFFSYADR